MKPHSEFLNVGRTIPIPWFLFQRLLVKVEIRSWMLKCYLTRKKFHHSVTAHRNRKSSVQQQKFDEKFFLKKDSLFESFNWRKIIDVFSSFASKMSTSSPIFVVIPGKRAKLKCSHLSVRQIYKSFKTL